MSQANTFIGYLKTEQPLLWQTISKAAAEGLIVIDEAGDGITATNRLLLTYPDLHTVLNFLVESWLRKQTDEIVATSVEYLMKGTKGNNGKQGTSSQGKSGFPDRTTTEMEN